MRGALIALTALEYRLLYHLVHNAGHVLMREALLARVWGDEYRDQSDYPKVSISRLRVTLEDDTDRPRYIVTEWGLGYRFARGGTKAGVERPRPLSDRANPVATTGLLPARDAPAHPSQNAQTVPAGSGTCPSAQAERGRSASVGQSRLLLRAPQVATQNGTR